MAGVSFACRPVCSARTSQAPSPQLQHSSAPFPDGRLASSTSTSLNRICMCFALPCILAEAAPCLLQPPVNCRLDVHTVRNMDVANALAKKKKRLKMSLLARDHLERHVAQGKTAADAER
eukprot:m.119980 g.119980  ORF g.119980 m.119980 type:complete len:120 (-) comp9568_c0_seq2:28-387(-)